MLTKYEKQILGMARQKSNGIEWLQKSYPQVYSKAKKKNRILTCQMCGETIVKINSNRKICEPCRDQHARHKAKEWKETNGKMITVTKEAWQKAGWFSDEKLDNPRFDGFLGVVDNQQCYLDR